MTDHDDYISRKAALDKGINVPIAKVLTEDKVIYRKIVFADDIEKLPPVTPQPKTDVLDKIRAEIIEISINGQIDEYTSFIRTGEQVKKMVLDIIDKYNAESEGKNK